MGDTSAWSSASTAGEGRALSKRIGLGLLGFGWIAEIAHLPALLGSRSLRLIAAAEQSPERRALLAKRAPGVRLHEDTKSLLEDAEVEAVLIALPTAVHAEAACAAFEAGRHVYVEKPLATDMEGGRAAVRAWYAAGTTGAVGFNFRRNPIFEAAVRRVAAGELGELVGIQGSFQWAAERIEGWRAAPTEGGGVLLDLVSHHVDLAAAVSGRRLAEVRCTLRSLRSEEDAATVEGVTADGMPVQLFASFVAGAQVNRLELVGRKGALRADLLEGHPRLVEHPPGRGARLMRGLQALRELHPARLLRSPGWEPSFQAALEAFGTAVAQGNPFEPDPEDGLYALAVVEAARASARNGGWSYDSASSYGGVGGLPIPLTGSDG